jgi:prepilin-type processing-associated H-X9-DG protein
MAPNYPQGTGPNSAATQSSPGARAFACWAAGVLSLNGSTGTENTNTAMLVDHVLYPNGAFLGPYVKTPAVFKCPADLSQGLVFGRQYPRARSVSMNNFVGSPSQSKNSSGASQYPTYRKTSNLRSPTATFVFLDERQDSINDATFFTSADNPATIIDIPASYHAGAAGFSFADGHSEIHKWISSEVKQPIQATPINAMSVSGNSAGLQDSYWLCQHAIGLNSFP